MSLTASGLPRRSANIFINYRREDSAGHTGRLFDHLSGRFPGRVFMDVDTIDPGIDFVEVIEQAVSCCEVLLVVIGNEWLDARDAHGKRRLDNPADFVRLEIAAALERKIRIIPVLVKDAAMPRPEDLPPDLIKLTRRNAIELSDARFVSDVDRLIQAIEVVLQEKAPSALLRVVAAPGTPPPAPRRRAPARRATMALCVAGLLVLAGWLGWRGGALRDFRDSVRSSPATSGTPAAPPPALSPAEPKVKETARHITPKAAHPPKKPPRGKTTPERTGCGGSWSSARQIRLRRTGAALTPIFTAPRLAPAE